MASSEPRIVRHRERTPVDVALPDDEAADAVCGLMEERIGSADYVLGEIVSTHVQLQVHVVAPSENDRAWTLYTTGMSDRPMAVPADVAAPRHVELVLRLPADWQVSELSFRDERWSWPVEWIRRLARLPHEHGTFVGQGHTVPNGDPPRPLARNTRLCGFLFGPTLILPEEEERVRLASGKEIAMLGLYPIHASEMETALVEGSDVLFDMMMDAGVGDVVDVRRRPIV
jgi:hypothetical protein